MTDRSGLVRLAALAGGSAALYSVALAAVVALQSQADAAVIARRQPAQQALENAAAGNDRLEWSIGRAAGSYSRVASDYDELAGDLAELHDSVDALGSATEDVSGRAAALPADITLPRLTRPSTTVRVTTTKVVHATSGASG